MCPVIKNGQGEPSAAIGKKTALNIANFSEQAKGIILRARAEADEILAQARVDAGDIRNEAEAELAQTRSEAEQLKQSASEEGYSEGLEKGKLDGQADGAEKAFDEAMTRFDGQCSTLKELLRMAVLQLDEARGEILRQAKSEMLQFAMDIAHRITGLQAAGDPDAANKILSRVLSSAPCARRLSLRVNPEQFDQLKVYAEEYIASISSDTKVDVVGDPELQPGDVVLQTPEGGVDGRVSIQFDNIARAITGQEYTPIAFEDFDESCSCKLVADADVLDEADIDAESESESELEAEVQDENIELTETASDPDEIERMMDKAGQLVDKLNSELHETGSLEEGSDLSQADSSTEDVAVEAEAETDAGQTEDTAPVDADKAETTVENAEDTEVAR